jgi:hypothetical protein
VISLDSSGAKVTNRSKWIRQKWKVHISVDDKDKPVVSIEVTEGSVPDTKEFENLV